MTGVRVRTTRAGAPAKRPSRSSISGTSARGDVDRAVETFFDHQWPDAQPAPEDVRDVRVGARARHRRRGSTPIDALVAETARELAARTDGGARPSDPADGRLRADARPRHAAGRRHQRGARAGADVQHRGRGEVHQRHARRASERSSAHAHDFARRTTAAAARQPRRARQARRGHLPAPVRPDPHDHGARRRLQRAVARRARGRADPDDRRAAAFSASDRSARPTSSCCRTAWRRSRSTCARTRCRRIDFQMFKLLDFGDWIGVDRAGCSGPRRTS